MYNFAFLCTILNFHFSFATLSYILVIRLGKIGRINNITKPLVFNESNIVSKSNSIVEARYKLGTMEQKVIAAIASNISPNDKDFQTYTFSIKDFKELLGTNSKAIYKEIDRIMTKLMQPFNFINAEGKPTRIARSSKATYNVGEGTVTVRFDPDLKLFLLLLNEKFNRYKLVILFI